MTTQEQQQELTKPLVVVAVSPDDTHAPLVARLFKCKATTSTEAPHEINQMVSRVLFDQLTLRSLLNLCTACKQPPTAAMLAIALQHSIPSLTGLPMDNPDPAFYIDIAKSFFNPANTITIQQQTGAYIALQPGRFNGALNGSLEDAHGFEARLDTYVHHVLYMKQDLLRTKKGRDFMKSIILQWIQAPLYLHPGMQKVYDHLLNILDHGFVLRHRALEPGCIGHMTHSIGDDEHL